MIGTKERHGLMLSIVYIGVLFTLAAVSGRFMAEGEALLLAAAWVFGFPMAFLAWKEIVFIAGGGE